MSTNAFASNNQTAVHLLSYLAQDYGEAVQNGKVINKEEYQEQLDFSKEVVRIMNENNYDKDLKQEISNLSDGIVMKKNADYIAATANKIKSSILKKFNLSTYPKSAINLVRAKRLYQNNCMSCHGNDGYGDGVAGTRLKPSPTNFHSLERMQNVSPFGAFNTISLGVNGTGMAPHAYLSEEDRWSLAYYITSFRFQNIKKIKGITLNIKDSSSLSDKEIKNKYGLDDEKFMGVLAAIRSTNSNPPSTGKTDQVGIHVKKTVNNLKESLRLYSSGKNREAKNAALAAYLQGFEPIEGILKSNNKGLVYEIEADMSKYRSLLKNNRPKEELSKVLSPLITKLESFTQMEKYEKTNKSSFLIAFGVVLREAFEAGLILFLLLSLTRKFNAKIFNKHIHTGWISSLFLGIILYFVLDNFITIDAALAESLEGYTALIAAALLFYVGYWMHKNTDIQKLKKTFTSAVGDSLKSGKGVTLFLIVFTAVFREIFEVLLFLKILILDGYEKLPVVFGAFFAIMVAIITISAAISYSIKLNLKYMFRASTVLILSLSVIFLGKGIGALQETGIFEETKLNITSLSPIGFNATSEVLIAQVTMIIIILAYTLIASKRKQLEKITN